MILAARKYFYPRSPCGERRRRTCHKYDSREFLSTLSLRRATGCPRLCERPTTISIHALLAESDVCLYRLPLITLPISIHALLAESDKYARFNDDFSVISIHALLAESDAVGSKALNQRQAFLSTLSLRRATIIAEPLRQVFMISIHALLAESDGCEFVSIKHCRLFLSTLSLRRATACRWPDE